MKRHRRFTLLVMSCGMALVLDGMLLSTGWGFCTTITKELGPTTLLDCPQGMSQATNTCTNRSVKVTIKRCFPNGKCETFMRSIAPGASDFLGCAESPDQAGSVEHTVVREEEFS
jgi:hypothetical protein